MRSTNGPIVAIPFRLKSDTNIITGSAIKLVQNEYTYIRNEVESYTDIALRSFLNKRGWTLQEDLLSPRTIHYSSPQLHWECQKHRRSEHSKSPVEMGRAFSLGSRIKHSFLQSSTNPILRGSWYAIVTEYMQRGLTKREDNFLPFLV